MPPVYYYQDWYAVVAIIYETVTGRLLFIETARTLIRSMKIIQRQGKDTARRRDCFKSESCRFWKVMWQEFDQKTAAEANGLNTVTLPLPDDFRELLLACYKKREQMHRQRAADFILSATPFKDQQVNQKLLTSPAGAIRKQRENWKTNTGVPRVKPAVQKKIIAFYDRLVRLQHQAEKMAGHFGRLEEEYEMTIKAGALMEMMLICVYSNMYRHQWQSAPTTETDIPTETGEKTMPAADDEMNITISVDLPS